MLVNNPDTSQNESQMCVELKNSPRLRSILTKRIEDKQHYLIKIISFNGERVPSETNNMLSVGATQSAAISEQFPGFVVQFDKF